MVDYIKGSIKLISSVGVIIDVGAIGFMVTVPFPSAYKVGDIVELYAYMHWNSEQGPSLFGFSSPIEKEVFLIVISCSGVGPKIGMAVLQDLGSQAFLNAVQTGDDNALSKVSGIGSKKAEQMIVQLKHKVAKLAKFACFEGDQGDIAKMSEVSDVLKSLHYSKPEISAAMRYLSDKCGGKDYSFDQLIRFALSFLSKGK